MHYGLQIGIKEVFIMNEHTLSTIGMTNSDHIMQNHLFPLAQQLIKLNYILYYNRRQEDTVTTI